VTAVKEEKLDAVGFFGRFLCLLKRSQMASIRFGCLFCRSRFLKLEARNIRVSTNNSRNAAVRHPFNWPTATQNPNVVPVTMAFAVFERILCKSTRVLAIGLVANPLSVIGVNPGQPRSSRAIDIFIEPETPHQAPHTRVENAIIAKVVVPDALTRALKSSVPSALALNEGSFGSLLGIDVLNLNNDIDRLPGAVVSQNRCGDPAPESGVVLSAVEALGAVRSDFT
jgi:hypothetical protein